MLQALVLQKKRPDKRYQRFLRAIPVIEDVFLLEILHIANGATETNEI